MNVPFLIFSGQINIHRNSQNNFITKKDNSKKVSDSKDASIKVNFKMSEEFGDEDSRRLAVEAKVFKRLDKRREEKSAIQAINKV